MEQKEKINKTSESFYPMEIEDQKSLWNRIAPEWHKHKEKPSENAVKFLENTKGNVLDLGSGSGRHLMKIKEGKMFLSDFSERMLELAKGKAEEKKIPAEFLQNELDDIPKPDNFFDYAICISALHCIPTEKRREKVAKELFRVLKQGGEVYIGVWNANSKRLKRKNAGKERFIAWTDKGKRYYHLFDEKEAHELFENAGFKVISTHNSEMMINFIIKK